jgi:hypothetical protein
MIAHNLLHGSGRAALPHPALAFGDDAHAAQGIGMTDGRRRQPASSDAAPHMIPKNAAVLAASRQRAVPERPCFEAKERQRRCVHGHAVISDVLTHHRLQLLAQYGDGLEHASLKLGFRLMQLRLQPFAYRLPQPRVPSIAPLRTDVREAKKIERLRFPFFTRPPVVDRERTEVVRDLLRCSGSVRLPRSARHRHSSVHFPMRPKATSAVGKPRISRFPREVRPNLLGVLDRAGLPCTSRYRCAGWGLTLSLTGSASRSNWLTRLNTRPARIPLSTLRRCPRERLRVTLGRGGSLHHIRMTFSITTPRRFNRRTKER